VIQDGAGTVGLSKAGTGTLILSGDNTYRGPTTVNAGALIVNGSLINSATTVNSGALLGGTGTLGSTTINGGILSPGNSIGTLTIQGSLVMSSAAAYIVELSPSSADRTNVAGTANLAGTVQALFAPGSFVSRSYTILSAAGGRSGTFDALATTNLPAGFTAGLSYTADDVTLNIIAALATAGFNQNQRNVGNAINNFFNNGGALPPGFVSRMSAGVRSTYAKHASRKLLTMTWPSLQRRASARRRSRSVARRCTDAGGTGSYAR